MNDAVPADTLSILYGKSAMELRLPRDARPTVIGKRTMAKLPDPSAAVRDALARPIGAAPYDALVRGRTSACILICDITRPVPNHLFLRQLIEGLIAGGMRRDAITVLVSTGLHRSNEGAVWPKWWAIPG
jgi:nickel-dependent lactate racemase